MKKYSILLLVFLLPFFSACFEDQDDNLLEASTSDINDFIWRGLNFFYVYKSSTPELANDAFTSDQEFSDFLNSYATPEDFFNFLKAPQDRFSILVEDYVELENSLAGTSETTGMEYGLVFYPYDSGNIFGYVRYVNPNTDAANKGVTRGMIFNTVDGVQITENNFATIFDGSGFTIGLADFDGENITPRQESITLVKSNYTENPIGISRVVTVNGQKIGYLLYNAFTNEFDSELNAAFATFKSEGITDLVVDFRYNSGGSVRSAVYLSSMITGQFTGEVFYTEQWNEDRQGDYAQDGLFLNNFANGGETINSLNLTQVYILTTTRTASASELVINGLAPYIDVVQIGKNTRGKYQASFLMYDAPSPNFRRSEANPNHRYAMLPLVFQTANATGFTNYDDGLIPDIELEEDYANLGVLGDENEPLFAQAIAEITGLPAPTRNSFQTLEVLSERKAQLIDYQVMWVSGKE